MRLITDDAIAIITIWQEARGESYAGKVAVAEVIRNRVTRKYNCDGTIAGACLRAFQFSGFNTTDPNRVPSFKLDNSNPVVAECAKAWDQAKNGGDMVCQAVLYLNPRILKEIPAWVSVCDHVATVGNHDFYRPKRSVET